MDVKTIKLCPLYESCPRVQARNNNYDQILSNNVEYIGFDYYPCLRRKPGQRKGHFCMMKIDLDLTTPEKALDDVLKHRKKYTKYYYASEVNDYINKLKEAIKNGWSSGES